MFKEESAVRPSSSDLLICPVEALPHPLLQCFTSQLAAADESSAQTQVFSVPLSLTKSVHLKRSVTQIEHEAANCGTIGSQERDLRENIAEHLWTAVKRKQMKEMFEVHVKQAREEVEKYQEELKRFVKADVLTRDSDLNGSIDGQTSLLNFIKSPTDRVLTLNNLIKSIVCNSLNDSKNHLLSVYI